MSSECTTLSDNQETVLKAGCKINLGLRITGRREDGYHLLDSIFCPLDEPHDTLFIRKNREEGIRIHCDTAGIDQENNTLTRAFSLYRQAGGTAPGLTIRLVKGIPWGAGLGGGSSDAAVLLRFLQKNAKEQALPEEELRRIAAHVGADVPFFLTQGIMRVTGIGDILEPCTPALPGNELLLVTPGIPVSTPLAYRTFDELSAKPYETQAKALTKSSSKDKDSTLPAISGGKVINDLELAVFPLYPEISAIRDRLLALGAAAASMSGSGSAVFGLFREHETAKRARDILSASWQVYLSRINTGV